MPIAELSSVKDTPLLLDGFTRAISDQLTFQAIGSN